MNSYINFFKKHLSATEKKRLVLVFMLMLLGMIFEIFSIGALVPLFSVFSNPDNYSQYKFLEGLSQKEIIIYLTVGIFLIFSTKTAFFAWMSRFQAKFSYQIMARISSKLFYFYSSNSYNLSVKKDSSVAMRNIIREPAFLVGSILLPLITIFTEVFVILGILLLLIFYSPISTLYVAVFIAITGFLLMSYTKPKLKRLGKEVQANEAKRIKQVNYSLSGAKDFILLNLRETFFEFFKSYTNYATHNLARHAFYKQIVKTLLEYFAIIAICGLIIFLILIDTKPYDILTLVGIYLVAFFRILPSSNRIIVSWNFVAFNNATLVLLTKELDKCIMHEKKLNEIESDEFLDNWDKIVLKNISFKYDDTEKNVFENFSHEIFKYDFCAITGSSGSGKSTIVDLILGILKPQKGEVQTHAGEVRKQGLNIPSKEIGYVPQNTFLLDESILANITLQDYYNNTVDKNNLHKAVHLSALDNLIEELDDGIHHKVGEGGMSLSGGQIQRIGIARGLYANPSFLILDEATSALDYENEEKIIKNLFSLKDDMTLLFISHSESVLKYFDNIIKIGK